MAKRTTIASLADEARHINEAPEPSSPSAGNSQVSLVIVNKNERLLGQTLDAVKPFVGVTLGKSSRWMPPTEPLTIFVGTRMGAMD